MAKRFLIILQRRFLILVKCLSTFQIDSGYLTHLLKKSKYSRIIFPNKKKKRVDKLKCFRGIGR